MPSPAKVRATADRVAHIGRNQPVRTCELLAGGLVSAQLKAAARAKTIIALHRGIWVPTSVWMGADADMQLRLAIQAAMQAFPGTVASHDTARQLHALPALGVGRGSEQATKYPLDHTSTAIPLVTLTRPGTRIMRGRIVVRDAPLDDAWINHLHGIPVTDPMRTALDGTIGLTDAEALALLDAGCRAFIAKHVDARELRTLIHHGRLPIDWRQALGERFDGRLPWRDSGRVGRLLALVNPAAESPLESMSRWHMEYAGLPAPRCGVPITVRGGQTFWADFCWKAQRVIGEADGAAKYTATDDLVAEKHRQQLIEEAGWRVVRWNWDEGVVASAIMISRLRGALDA